jgi:hypothetical protein
MSERTKRLLATLMTHQKILSGNFLRFLRCFKGVDKVENFRSRAFLIDANFLQVVGAERKESFQIDLEVKG